MTTPLGVFGGLEDASQQSAPGWTPIRVAVCGPQRFTRQALLELVALEPDMVGLAAKRSAGSLAETLGDTRPDCVVAISGRGISEEIQALGRVWPETSIVVIGSAVKPWDVHGSNAVHLADDATRIGHIMAAIRSSARRVSDIAVIAALAGGHGTAGSSQLSDRDFLLLGFLAQGMTTSQIAAQVGLSPRSVTAARSRLYKKLGVSSDARAVATAVREGLLTIPAQPDARRL